MILTRFSCAVPMMGFFAMLSWQGFPTPMRNGWSGTSKPKPPGAFSVAQSDDEEKDIWPADLNKDGWTDVIVVRKSPFCGDRARQIDLLLMNQEGTLVDMTAELAPSS